MNIVGIAFVVAPIMTLITLLWFIISMAVIAEGKSKEKWLQVVVGAIALFSTIMPGFITFFAWAILYVNSTRGDLIVSEIILTGCMISLCAFMFEPTQKKNKKDKGPKEKESAPAK